MSEWRHEFTPLRIAGVVAAAGALVGAGLAAAFTERVGVISMLTVQGLGYLIAGIGFALLMRGHHPSVAPPDEPARAEAMV